jgi:hypothetical protein
VLTDPAFWGRLLVLRDWLVLPRKWQDGDMTPEEFLASSVSNLQLDGFAVTQVELPSGPATIGYQGKFRLRWVATKLNLFTVVATRPEATSDVLSGLISDSIDYAKKTKGRLRGLQTGVAVIPILASVTVAPDAIELVRSRPVKGFAAMAMPAIVDLSTGESYFYEGKLIIGAIYTKWLRERMTHVLAVR